MRGLTMAARIVWHTAWHAPRRMDVILARWVGAGVVLTAAGLLMWPGVWPTNEPVGAKAVDERRLERRADALAFKKSNPKSCLAAKGQPTARLRVMAGETGGELKTWANGLDGGSGPVVRLVVGKEGDVRMAAPKNWTNERQQVSQTCLAQAWAAHKHNLRQERLGWVMMPPKQEVTTPAAPGRSAMLGLFAMMAVMASLAGAMVHTRRMAGGFEVFAAAPGHRWMIVMLPVLGAWLPVWAVAGLAVGLLDRGLLGAWLSVPAVMMVAVSWSSTVSVLFRHVYGRRWAGALVAPVSVLVILQSRTWLLGGGQTMGADLAWHVFGLIGLAGLLVVFFEWRCGWRGEGLRHVV